MAEAAPVDGGFYLRLDALEAKLEAQVPKTLNLESQMLKLQNDFEDFCLDTGFLDIEDVFGEEILEVFGKMQLSL